MNTIGKNGVKVVERHLVTQELNDEVKARLESVENRRPEVRREEMTDALHRVALLEKQVDKLREWAGDCIASHIGYIQLHAGDIRKLQDRLDAQERRPAQVLRETTIEKPGVTLHEHTIERVPHTDKWVWVILGVLSLAQVAQLWRLL